jgi:hypothetical protein
VKGLERVDRVVLGGPVGERVGLRYARSDWVDDGEERYCGPIAWIEAEIPIAPSSDSPELGLSESGRFRSHTPAIQRPSVTRT